MEVLSLLCLAAGFLPTARARLIAAIFCNRL
jgi:hypothetical protein